MSNVHFLRPLLGDTMQPVLRWAIRLPLYSSTVQAGFPSPAEDYVETNLDMNEYLIKRPAATFYARVKGDSMTGAGIHDGDVLVVDKSIKPTKGHIVLAAIDGELTVKRLDRWKGEYLLKAENPVFPTLRIPEGSELRVWGVVTGVVRKL